MLTAIRLILTVIDICQIYISFCNYDLFKNRDIIHRQDNKRKVYCLKKKKKKSLLQLFFFFFFKIGH